MAEVGGAIAQTARDASHMDQMHNDLCTKRDHLSTLVARADGIVARTYGDDDNAKTDQPREVAQGMVGQLQYVLQDIEELQSRLDVALDKIARLV